MSALIRAFILALLLLFAATSGAHGFRSRPVTIAAYFYPAPVAYEPVHQAYYVVPSMPIPVCHVVIPTVSSTPWYAVPRPAPPSGEPVLPSTREPPRVSESRSLGGHEAKIPIVAEKRYTDRCRVGFWNVSHRDLVLRINGAARTLPRGKSVTLDLGREFVWQVEGSEVKQERVAADKSSLEIVLRR